MRQNRFSLLQQQQKKMGESTDQSSASKETSISIEEARVKIRFQIEKTELLNMKKKSLTAGMVVETADTELLGLSEEHSLVAPQY